MITPKAQRRKGEKSESVLHIFNLAISRFGFLMFIWPAGKFRHYPA